MREGAPPLTLPRRSAALRSLQRLRDEAHRFGITYHRKLRGRARIASALDAVPGVGPARRAALLKAFGSVAAMNGVPADEIARRAGVPLPLAARVAEAGAGGARAEAARCGAAAGVTEPARAPSRCPARRARRAARALPRGAARRAPAEPATPWTPTPATSPTTAPSRRATGSRAGARRRPTFVDAYFALLLKRGLSGATVARRRSALRGFHAWLEPRQRRGRRPAGRRPRAAARAPAAARALGRGGRAPAGAAAGGGAARGCATAPCSSWPTAAACASPSCAGSSAPTSTSAPGWSR